KPKPLSLKVAVPSAGDVTLARSFFEVRAPKGKRLPKRLRFKAEVRNRKKLPRTVDAFFTAVKVKSKKNRVNRASYAALFVITRRKDAASSSQSEEKEEFADLFWVILGSATPRAINKSEDRNALRLAASQTPPSLCIDTVANFETFPSIESLLDSAPPVAEVMAKRFSPRRNLRYAFAA